MENTPQNQEKLPKESAELLKHGIPLEIDIDYGITTDAYGPKETMHIWHNEIGKAPPTE